MPTIFIFIILFMIKFCTPKINKKYIVSKIKRENLELFVDMKGTVAANNVTKIGLDVNLLVDDVYFKAGDFVKKGDIIVKFSDYQKNNINEKKMSENSGIARRNFGTKTRNTARIKKYAINSKSYKKPI